MKIELESGAWLVASGNEYPQVTLEEEKAKEFGSLNAAMIALEEARKFAPFENASIQEDFIFLEEQLNPEE